MNAAVAVLIFMVLPAVAWICFMAWLERRHGCDGPLNPITPPAERPAATPEPAPSAVMPPASAKKARMIDTRPKVTRWNRTHC